MQVVNRYGERSTFATDDCCNYRFTKALSSAIKSVSPRRGFAGDVVMVSGGYFCQCALLCTKVDVGYRRVTAGPSVIAVGSIVRTQFESDFRTAFAKEMKVLRGVVKVVDVKALSAQPPHNPPAPAMPDPARTARSVRPCVAGICVEVSVLYTIDRGFAPCAISVGLGQCKDTSCKMSVGGAPCAFFEGERDRNGYAKCVLGEGTARVAPYPVVLDYQPSGRSIDGTLLTSNLRFTYLAEVSGFSPALGSIGGGRELMVVGRGFDAANPASMQIEVCSASCVPTRGNYTHVFVSQHTLCREMFACCSSSYLRLLTSLSAQCVLGDASVSVSRRKLEVPGGAGGSVDCELRLTVGGGTVVAANRNASAVREMPTERCSCS